MVTTDLMSMEDYSFMLWQCLLLHYSVLVSTQEIAGRQSEYNDLLGAQNPQPQSDLGELNLSSMLPSVFVSYSSPIYSHFLK